MRPRRLRATKRAPPHLAASPTIVQAGEGASEVALEGLVVEVVTARGEVLERHRIERASGRRFVVESRLPMEVLVEEAVEGRVYVPAFTAAAVPSSFGQDP
jgi:hypothetical protein